VAYKMNGEQIDYFPFDITKDVEPVYVEMKGWKADMTTMTDESQFPKEFNDYMKFLEKELQVPITIVSVGPDRNQTIVRK
jgi:adenylosuccinate synthase